MGCGVRTADLVSAKTTVFCDAAGIRCCGVQDGSDCAQSRVLEATTARVPAESQLESLSLCESRCAVVDLLRRLKREAADSRTANGALGRLETETEKAPLEQVGSDDIDASELSCRWMEDLTKLSRRNVTRKNCPQSCVSG